MGRYVIPFRYSYQVWFRVASLSSKDSSHHMPLHSQATPIFQAMLSLIMISYRSRNKTSRVREGD
jgi:hypothetical protein